jgi:hypothetical protein
MALQSEYLVPAGAILMWSGILANIPAGWNLCDGTNGTPDLRSKFIKSVAASENPGVTGGNLTHTHADHVYTPVGTVGGIIASLTAAVKIGTSSTSGAANTHTHPAPSFAGIQANLAHDSPNHEPPYFKLAFIMKL